MAAGRGLPGAVGRCGGKCHEAGWESGWNDGIGAEAAARDDTSMRVGEACSVCG